MSTDKAAQLRINPDEVELTLSPRPEANDAVARRALSRGVMWTLAARILMVASSVGTGLIVARCLNAQGLGTYAVLSVTVSTAVQIGGAGLTAANIYFTARERLYLKPASVNALIFALVAGTVLALSIIALASFEPTLFRNIPLTLVAIAAASIPFLMLVLFGLNVFLVLGRVVQFNLLDTLGQSFVLINAVFVLIIVGTRRLIPLLFLNTIVSLGMSILISCLVYRCVARDEDGCSWRASVPLFGRMMRYGLKFNVSMTATMLIFRSDLLLVNYFRGAAEAGVYSVATQGGLLLMLAPNVIGTLLFPHVASMGDTSGEFTAVVTRYTSFLMALVCLLAIPGAFILSLLYGAQFSDAATQLLILLPGVYLIGLEIVLVQHFVGTGLPKIIPAFWVSTLLFNIALNLVIIPTFGARGAAFVSTISYTLIFALVLIYFRAKTGKSFGETLVIRRAELRHLYELLRRSATTALRI